MDTKIMAVIQAQTQDIREFIDKDDYVPLLNPLEVTQDELTDAYRHAIDYYSQVSTHSKKINYLISQLTEKKMGLTTNTPQGANTSKQINNYLGYLKDLKEALIDINNKCYYHIRFYEKWC